MHKHILVPLDGSSFGERALSPALALARRTGAKLTLLSVQDLWAASAAELRYEEREEYLARIARKHRFVDTPVQVVVRSGHPTEQILEEVESSEADLILMSTHGRGGVTRMWLGSVADRCLRHTGVPLLLIRPQPAAQVSGDGVFLPPRVVVPLDGTAGAERALGEATGIARAFGIPIHLVRVLGLDEEPAPARGYLDGVAQRLRRAGVQPSVTAVRNRHAADAILAEAAGDPIVMSTHARSPIARAVIGSVADKVVRGTRGAVLLVPPPSAPAMRPVPDAVIHVGS